MIAAIWTALTSRIAGYLAVAGGVLAAVFAVYREGQKNERAKQVDAERNARDIADQVDNDVGALPPGKAREELKKWAR